MRRHSLFGLVAALLTAIVLVVVPAAGAHRAATRLEAAAISAAAHRSGLTKLVKHFRLARLIISTKGPYAAAILKPTGRRAGDTASAVFARHRKSWRLVTLGSADVGCSLPRAVRSDLAADGIGCIRR